jgi:Ca2+/Na+ antiporter
MNPIKYEEQLRGPWTTGLFLLLTALFWQLLTWRYRLSGLDFLAWVFLIFFAIFLFYSLNYTTLVVRIDEQALVLTFGLITWKVSLENIRDCRLDDDLPRLLRYGGAGIHGYNHRRRYRISFNFLEHPRVAVTLKKKKGPIQEVSFSTRHPQEVLNLLGQLTRGQNIDE